MRVLSLKLENVGPFDAAEMELVSDPVAEKAPIALLTGINGTGKTIVLDAIRGMFGPAYGMLERAIWRKKQPFRAEMRAQWGKNQLATILANQHYSQWNGQRTLYYLGPGYSALWNLPSLIQTEQTPPSWIVDYWPSVLATDTYEIPMFKPPPYKEFLQEQLQGAYSNANTTNCICYFDYLRDSREKEERRVGDFFFGKVAEILAHSLLDGHLEDVARTNFTPMIRQSGHVVPLANISSGNAYLSQRLMSVLWKAYAVFMLKGVALEEACNLPGLILIDEAENHLHPLWQKRFFKIIHSVFPNLQIIAATHSPFILASAPGARVFVCRYEKERGGCVIEEASDTYANKPVEEILVSEAFDHTQPFSEEISDLIVARKDAIEREDWSKRKEIEGKLKRTNPEYFSYFDMEERLRAVAGAR